MLAPAPVRRRRCAYQRYRYRPMPVIPGLVCAACEHRFDGRPARVTDAGYVHSDPCPVSPATLTEGRWLYRNGVARWVTASPTPGGTP